MVDIIKKAIELRKEKKFSASRELLLPLLEYESYFGIAHLNIAWSYDNEGKEEDAINHYKLSLLGKLTKEERFETIFGLACTYRSIGNYSDSLIYFEEVLRDYPNEIQVIPFYAMCLHNVDRNEEAIILLLELIAQNSNNKKLNDYKEVILLYSENLNRKW